MREFLALLLAWCVVSVGLVRAGEKKEIPYVAYVATDQTAVRSGPGDQFYATGFLGTSARLEVYRQEPGGWLAVRPPAGSFSWVRGDQLRATDEPGVAEVVVERTKAWVGTELPQRPPQQWQVHLRQGELVEVLAEHPDDGTHGSWFRISPPAGEFRWVHRQHVSRSPPRGREPDLTPPLELDSADPLATTLPPAEHGGAGASEAAEAEPDVELRPVETLADERAIAEQLPNVGELELELARMAALDVSQWQLRSLRAAAGRLARHGATAVERGRARLVLERIDQFDRLRVRHEALEVSSSSSPAGAVQLAVYEEPAAAEPGDAATTDYDARGWLVPVRSSHTRGMPPYALVDADGQILHFVTPTPGLSLHRHLEQEVGLFGQRGFIPDWNVPHLTVQRLVRMDRHRARRDD